MNKLPRLFAMMRRVDKTGVSGVGHVADGVLWPDETVVIRWRGQWPSTAFYASLSIAKNIHCHDSATTILFHDEVEELAAQNCLQDGMENAAFASVGGIENRSSMTAPRWIPPVLADRYLTAYRAEAFRQYGEDWETCKFGWVRALEITSRPDPDLEPKP